MYGVNLQEQEHRRESKNSEAESSPMKVLQGTQESGPQRDDARKHTTQREKQGPRERWISGIQIHDNNFVPFLLIVHLHH